MRGKPECVVPPPPSNNITHIIQWRAPDFVLCFPFGIPEIILNSSLLHAINPLNAELNPICYLLALLGAHHFLHVSRIRVNIITDLQD